MSISYNENDDARVNTIPAFKTMILNRIARMDSVMCITGGSARHEIELEHRILQWVLFHLEDIRYNMESTSNHSDDLNKMKNEIRCMLQKY